VTAPIRPIAASTVKTVAAIIATPSDNQEAKGDLFFYAAIVQIVIDVDQTAPLTYLKRLTVARSCQFGDASAPRCPHRSRRSLGPNEGTGRLSE
jgi:hypothetical protein